MKKIISLSLVFFILITNLDSFLSIDAKSIDNAISHEVITELHKSSYNEKSNANNYEQTIFNFFINNMGVNTAVACGILANINAESGFNPLAECIDTNGLTSFGICQWNGLRFESLKSYCSNHDLNYKSINAQLEYLKYELMNSEKSAWEKVKDKPNTESGAYEAAYNWAKFFERCSSIYYEVRAISARDTYWKEYSSLPAVTVHTSGSKEAFQQTDERWCNYNYGYGTTIGSSGCGLLALVNAVHYLNGYFIDPKYLADYSLSNGYRIKDVGTAHAIYPAFINECGYNYGISYVGETASYEQLATHLMNNGVAVASAPNHLMAVVDYNRSSGEYLILDSAMSNSRGTTPNGYVWKTASEIQNNNSLRFDKFMMIKGNVCTACPGHNLFTDMPSEGHWAHDAIDWAVTTGVTNGVTQTTFAPEMICTRAQLVTFLWRAAGCPEISGSSPFKDVQYPSSWYYKAVIWGYNKGIIKGITTTTFEPNTICTRGQFVTFLWRYEGEPQLDNAVNPFTDMRKGAYYYNPAVWASYNGIAKGITDTTFAPDAPCTRAQAVTFLFRYFKNRLTFHGYQQSYCYGEYTSDFRPAEGGNGSIALNGHLYTLYKGNMSWYTAKEWCTKLGGYLATITSENEYEAVKDLIGANYVWLGATDRYGQNSWHWITDDPMNYNKWATAQPDNYRNIEHYMAMYGKSYDHPYMWNDLDMNSDSIEGFVCEQDLDPTQISKIYVRTYPHKTGYFTGEDLDTGGLTLYAEYNNGIKSIISNGFSCSPSTLTTAGTQKITVNYEGKVTSFNVNVENIYVTNLSVSQKPSKTEYFAGDKLDTTGLILTASYNNGNSTTITGEFSCSPTSLDTSGTQKIEVSYGGKETSFTVNVKSVEVSNISIQAKPKKVEYFAGEFLDTTGLTLSVSYNNGKTETVKSGFSCSPTTLKTVGTQRIVVSYRGKTATFNVQVNEPVISSLSVQAFPNKTNYYVGDTLDTTGLVIGTYYNNGDIKNITNGFSCSPTVLNTAGPQTISVSYAGKTTEFYVVVEEVLPTNLSIISLPNKTTYYVGDDLDTTGLTLMVYYNNRQTKTVTEGFICTPSKFTTAGTQRIEVSYADKTAMFNVLVSKVEASQISINALPAKTDYFLGDSLDTTGLSITVNYNNGSSKTVTSGFSCSPTILSTIGTQRIEVLYEGKVTTFNVQVNKAEAIEISEISINSLPAKNKYVVGDSLDTTGLSITAKYSDGSSKTVTNGCSFSPTVLNTAGTQKITVTYEGKTINFDVFVEKKAEENINSDSPSIAAAKVTGKSGQTINVPIHINNNPGIIATKISITYDKSLLTLVSVADGGLLGDNTIVSGKDLSSVPYNILWADSTATENDCENGTLVNLTFAINKDAEECVTPITVSCDNNSTLNCDMKKVYFSTVNGEVSISDVLLGDVNNDGDINLMDVVLINRWIVGGFGVTINETAADVNVDGTINLMDVVLLCRYIVGGFGVELGASVAITRASSGNKEEACTDSRAANKSRLNRLTLRKYSAAPAIEASSISGIAGDTVEYNIYIKNNPGIIATKLGITYDTNTLTLVGYKNSNLLGSLTASKNLTDCPFNLIWVNGLSDTNYSSDGVMITLVFRIKDSAQLGKTPISVNYDYNSTFNSNLDNVSFEITNGSINVIKADNQDVADILDYLSGKEIPSNSIMDVIGFADDGSIDLLDAYKLWCLANP